MVVETFVKGPLVAVMVANESIVSCHDQGEARNHQQGIQWERGEALAGRCQEWLNAAKARIEARKPKNPDQSPDS
jgi:exonuclease VII small subunit